MRSRSKSEVRTIRWTLACRRAVVHTDDLSSEGDAGHAVEVQSPRARGPCAAHVRTKYFRWKGGRWNTLSGSARNFQNFGFCAPEAELSQPKFQVLDAVEIKVAHLAKFCNQTLVWETL